LVHFHDPLSFWCFSFGCKFNVMITSPWLRSWQSARQFSVDKKGFVHVQIREKDFSTFCLKAWAKFEQLLTKNINYNSCPWEPMEDNCFLTPKV
jgi:hypothetical protein